MALLRLLLGSYCVLTASAITNNLVHPSLNKDPLTAREIKDTIPNYRWRGIYRLDPNPPGGIQTNFSRLITQWTFIDCTDLVRSTAIWNGTAEECSGFAIRNEIITSRMFGRRAGALSQNDGAGLRLEFFLSTQPERWHWRVICIDRTDLDDKGRCSRVVYVLNVREDLFTVNGEVRLQGLPLCDVEHLLKETTHYEFTFSDDLVVYTGLGPDCPLPAFC